MLYFNYETSRLKVLPLDENSYENVTKLYKDITNNCYATGLFENVSAESLKEKIDYTRKTKSFINLVAYTKKTNQFIAYLKCYTQGNKIIWINAFIVVPIMRRKGFGKEIIDSFSFYVCKYLDINVIALCVLDENKTAKMFWSSLLFIRQQTLIKTAVDRDKLSKAIIFVKKV